MVDDATGTMGALAISAVLLQRLRTGRGQYVDLAMLDVAMILQASHVTDYLHSGHHPRRAGNVMRFASTSAFPARKGMIRLAASNARQNRRFYEAIGDPDEAKRDRLEERHERHAEKLASVADKMQEKTADEWQACLEARHVPAARVGELREALADPQLESRRVMHRHESVPGVDKPVTLPLAAFTFAHGGPSIERPPRARGRAHRRGPGRGRLLRRADRGRGCRPNERPSPAGLYAAAGATPRGETSHSRWGNARPRR